MTDDYGDIVKAAAPPKPRKVVRGVEKLQGAQPELVEHWNNLQTEFDKQGLKPVIKSGYRTTADQQRLYNNPATRARTKGNDGIINISPHQEGRALDISFAGAQKEAGRRVIADYAKRNNLHVPSDEPWHIAIPKQKQGQSDDDYADVVKAAMGQDDDYSDVIAAAAPLGMVQGAAKGQAPLRTGKVTSRVMDDVGEDLPAKVKPITFEQEDSRTAEQQAGIGVLGRGIRRAVENVTSPELPANHPDLVGKRVPLKFANKPTPEQLNDAFLEQHGMRGIGEQFKKETGGQLLANLQGNAQPVWDADSKEWVVNVRPKKSVIDAINAYATGGIAGLRAQLETHDIGRAAFAKDAQAAMKQDEGFGLDVARTGVGQAASEAQLAQNIVSLAQGRAPWDDPTAKAIGEAKAAIPGPTTGTGEAADVVGSAAGAINRAGLIPGHVGFPAEIALENLQRGPEEAFKAGVTALPMMAAGPIVSSVAPEVTGLARQAATRTAAGALFGGTTAATGGDLREVAKSALTGGIFPIGEKGEPVVPERAETMQAQLDQRGFTLIPKDTQRPPLPRGTRTITTSDGTIYYDPKRVDAATVRNTPTQELLGHVEPKSESTTATVVARDADGREVHSSAVSPENVDAQAKLTQANFPEAQVTAGGPDLAADVIADRITPQRYQHLQFGEVEALEDQSGAGKGRTKVAEVSDSSKVHYVKTADLQGRGNSRMIPLKPTEAALEATPPPPASETASQLPTEDAPQAQSTSSLPTDRRNPDAIEPVIEEQRTGDDRRQDLVTREQFDAMTPDERHAALQKMETELRTNPLSDMPNRRAYDESDKKAVQVFSDIDGLKDFNDTYGHDSGDKLIQAKAEALKAEGLDSSHVSGDEFFHQFDTEAEAHDAMGRAQRRLENSDIEVTLPDGTKKTAKGATFSYGISKEAARVGDKHPAEAALKADKSARAAEGKRASGRGGKPVGIDEAVSEGQQDNQGDTSAQVAKPRNFRAYVESQGHVWDDIPKTTEGRKLLDNLRREFEEPTAPIPATVAKSTPESEVIPSTTATEPAYGSTNKLITTARADAARARLKAKLDPNRLSDIGDIASALPDLAELGAFHLEAGSRAFGSWSKQFLSEFDDKDRAKLQPHLKDIYERAGGLVEPKSSSVRNESTEALRRDLGQMEIDAPERKSFQQSIDNALEKGLDKKAVSLADAIIDGKQESLSNEEAAGVLHRMRELENEYESRHAANKSDPQLAKIEATLDKLTEATKKAGTATARDLSFRRATVDQDFKLISMIRQAKEAKGRDLTTEERTRYESIVQERDTAIAARDKAVTELNSKRLQNNLDRQSRQRSRSDTKETLDKEAKVIKDNIAAEFARLKAGREAGLYKSAGGLGALDPDGIITRNLLRYARNRAKAEVGLRAESLIDDAHKLVEDFGVTRRQVAEALSGYGKVAVDKRGEAAKRLSDIRSEITQLLKAEDVATGATTTKQQGPKRDLQRNENRLKVLQKAEAEWERKFNDRDFGTKEKVDYPYNSDVRRAEDRVKIAEAKFRREMERARPGHQFRNFSGIWKAWLLSGPPTQMMNIAGTGSYQAFREVARLPAAIADGLMSTATGRRTMQGPSPTAMLESVIASGTKGVRDLVETMRHGATVEQMKRHQFEEIDFGTNSRAIKAVELAHNAIFRFMSGSDRVFYQGALRRNLIDRATMQARNEGVSDVKARARDLMDDPDIKASAEHDAFVSTFNNDNVLSDKIKRARSAVIPKRSLMGKRNAQRLNAAENLAIDLILPFDRTPTNVIARILEASPLGYGKNAAQLISAAMRKSMPPEHQRQLAQTFGNATAGTAIMALGWYLAAPDKKLITVDDQDVNLNIPHLPKLNLRTASPLGNILAAGARMRTIHDDPKSSVGDYVKTALREPANQPVLRATTGLSDLMTNPDRSAGKFAGRLASSAIPFSGAARWVGGKMDPAEKRYADPSFKEQFQRNIPIARESLPSSRVRLLGSDVNKATKEAERLKITMKGATKQPDETPEDFAKRQAVQNGNIRAQIENVVAMPEYDKASDEDKVKWLKQAAQFASKQTMDSLPERPEKPEERQFPMPQPKGVGFDAAYPADALSKFERMNAADRAKVASSMTSKARTLLRDPRLSDEQKAEYKARLDALGISVTPPKPRRMRESIGANP